jgi:hypothetical protein
VSDKDRARLFEAWLAHMDDFLAEFMTSVPMNVRQKLDQSPASLDVLEDWLLRRYPSIDSARPATEAKVLDGAARYFGEVFRVVTKSRWSLQLGDPKTLYFGKPVLVDGKLGSLPECPLSVVTASLDRRTGKYLSGIVKNFSD